LVSGLILVVDTNIVFSALVHPSGTLGEILLNSHGFIQFCAPESLADELHRHRQKLIAVSKLSDEELAFFERLIYANIELISIKTLPLQIRQSAYKLVADIDAFDAPFLALSMHLKAPLWTGDKRLMNGLATKGIDWLIDTQRVQQLRGG
jgi:predicted nucleic acid-binding protein